MSHKKLFIALSIPKTPFVNGALGIKKTKKYKNKYELVESEKLADTLYHLIYKKDEIIFHCYYYIGDLDEKYERYLFVKNNDLYRNFMTQFLGRYRECEMDAYIDVNDSENILDELNQTYYNRFYNKDIDGAWCHIYGQQMWHGDAYIIANRSALIELKQAIDVALENEEARVKGLAPSDGEGYDLYIKCVDDDFEWDDLEMPYHDRECYFPDETTEVPPNKAFKNYPC